MIQRDKFDFHLLLHAAELVERRVAAHLAPLGIRPRQARILDALSRMGATSQATLAQQMDITPASMSTMAARLVDAGVIVREMDPNERRSNLLNLTQVGQDLVGEMRKAWALVDADIAQAIGSQNAHHLARLTRDLRDEFGGAPPWHEQKQESCDEQ